MKHLIPILSLATIALIGGFTDCKGGNQAGDSHTDSDSLFDGMCPCCLEDSVVVTEETEEAG